MVTSRLAGKTAFSLNKSISKQYMNQILITGGACFLGSHLTEKLFKEKIAQLKKVLA